MWLVSRNTHLCGIHILSLLQTFREYYVYYDFICLCNLPKFSKRGSIHLNGFVPTNGAILAHLNSAATSLIGLFLILFSCDLVKSTSLSKNGIALSSLMRFIQFGKIQIQR